MASPAQHDRRGPRNDETDLLRNAARRLAEAQRTGTARLRFAQHLVARAVEHYWRAQADVSQVRLRPCDASLAGRILSPDAETIARRLGEAAASLAPIEAAYIIGRTYTATLPANVRTDLGVYYTPPPVAERLLNQAESAGIDWREATVLDPACGGGAFLAPVAHRIAAGMKGTSPEEILTSIEARLRGYEVDAFASWMSQVFVDAVLLKTTSAARRTLKTLVSVRDTLDTPPVPEFDLVVGNPPYGRLRLTPARRERYARSLYGHANLYGLFTDYAMQSAKPGGLICYVTPTGFLGGEYFKNLRALLARDAPPEAIDFLAVRDGVFDDVLQEALLATYRKGGQKSWVQVSLVEPSESAMAIHHVGTSTLPPSPEHPWVLPRSRREASVAKRLGDLPHRLRDWGYSVSTGPLVWNRHKGQLRDRPGTACVPLIWAEAVGADGRFRFRAEKKNHAPYFKILPGDGPLLVDEPCVLVQRTTAKEQQRRLIAAELPADFLALHGHVTIENHLNMLKPVHRPDVVTGTTACPTVSPGTLAAFLNTEVADRAFRCLSGSVAVSAFELEALPLPDPESLGHVGDALRNGAPRTEIEMLCAKLYGF